MENDHHHHFSIKISSFPFRDLFFSIRSISTTQNWSEYHISLVHILIPDPNTGGKRNRKSYYWAQFFYSEDFEQCCECFAHARSAVARCECLAHARSAAARCECLTHARSGVALTSFWVLPYCQVNLIIAIGQQVIYLLLVDLQVRHCDLKEDKKLILIPIHTNITTHTLKAIHNPQFSF